MGGGGGRSARLVMLLWAEVATRFEEENKGKSVVRNGTEVGDRFEI